MVAIAPLPKNEAERLADLRSYRILDTDQADDRFDLFTRLGTWIFDAPLCAINIVDDERTFFKSLVGMKSYTPCRSTSLCGHAVANGRDVMIVEDLATDLRFSDHPLLTDKGVRFYAGALLRSLKGNVLGTICIADMKTRSFSSVDTMKLADLAKGVGSILELHRASLLLQEAAEIDSLTGLYNRRVFDARMSAMAEAPRRTPSSLLYIDLDRFKQVNDQFGHAGGDALLREVGHRLSDLIRGDQVAARIGGDEFAVLLPQPADVAQQMAQAILQSFTRPFEFERQRVSLQCSIGVASFPDDADNVVDVITQPLPERAKAESMLVWNGVICSV